LTALESVPHVFPEKFGNPSKATLSDLKWFYCILDPLGSSVNESFINQLDINVIDLQCSKDGSTQRMNSLNGNLGFPKIEAEESTTSKFNSVHFTVSLTSFRLLKTSHM
jgi:hypothetical protein